MTQYYTRALKLQGWMTEIRRYLHARPELSGREHATIRYIKNQLDILGIPWAEVEQGGLLGFLGQPGGGEPTVLLRADVDALPIPESERNLCAQKPSVSFNAGVSHTCGHDMHTATLLGAARLLKEWPTLPGSVILCFERGEEQCTGVEAVLRYLEDQPYTIDACYAAHVRADLDTGFVAAQPGVVMAGGGGFEVTLRGKEGHGSRPDLANNPIDCFAAFYGALQSLRLREADPFSALTYSVGELRAGKGGNVIPEALRFAGTMRSLDITGAGDRFVAAFRRLLEGAAAAYGCREELRFSRPLYEVRNNAACAGLVRQVVRGTLGKDALATLPPWMASESMGLYLKLWPGVLAFVGIRNEKKGTGANHHSAAFDSDEDALAIGCAVMAGFAREFILHPPGTGFARTAPSLEDVVTRSIR